MAVRLVPEDMPPDPQPRVFCDDCRWLRWEGPVPTPGAVACAHPHAAYMEVTALRPVLQRIPPETRNAGNDCADWEPSRRVVPWPRLAFGIGVLVGVSVSAYLGYLLTRYVAHYAPVWMGWMAQVSGR